MVDDLTLELNIQIDLTFKYQIANIHQNLAANLQYTSVEMAFNLSFIIQNKPLRRCWIRGHIYDTKFGKIPTLSHSDGGVLMAGYL